MCPDTRKVYATVVDKWDHLVRKDGGPTDDADFDAHMDQYRSTFFDEVSSLSLASITVS